MVALPMIHANYILLILDMCIAGRENSCLTQLMDQGYIEMAIRVAIIKFEYEFMGHGLDDVRVFIERGLVVVRLKGVFTPVERQLANTVEGVDIIKRLRQNAIVKGCLDPCEQVSERAGANPYL